MELDVENTYDGMDYLRWMQQAQQMKSACVRIIRQLPLEDQAVLEKHQSFLENANEAYAKLSYVTGYRHGLGHRKK